jgi:hypothetical protein
MNSYLYVVADPHDARLEMAARSAAIREHGEFHMIRPMMLDNASPRDRASVFFRPMAAALMKQEPLIMLGHWSQLNLDRPRERMLERAALTLGVTQFEWSKNDHVAVQHDGLLGSPRLSRVGGALPGYRPPALTASPASPAGAASRAGAGLPGAGAGGSRGSLPGLAGPGAGAWRTGQILLIGDKPNSAKHGDLKMRLPFFSLENFGCSLWLAAQLEDAGISEDQLYWINSADSSDTPTDPEFLSRLKPRQIIALGDNAEYWCNDAGLGYGYTKVMHPSYWKRSHFSKPYPLVKLLALA